MLVVFVLLITAPPEDGDRTLSMEKPQYHVGTHYQPHLHRDALIPVFIPNRNRCEIILISLADFRDPEEGFPDASHGCRLSAVLCVRQVGHKFSSTSGIAELGIAVQTYVSYYVPSPIHMR